MPLSGETLTSTEDDARIIAELREISESEGKEIIKGIALVVSCALIWWISVTLLFNGGFIS